MFLNLSKFGCQFLCAQNRLTISKTPCITPCHMWGCARANAQHFCPRFAKVCQLHFIVCISKKIVAALMLSQNVRFYMCLGNYFADKFLCKFQWLYLKTGLPQKYFSKTLVTDFLKISLKNTIGILPMYIWVTAELILPLSTVWTLNCFSKPH